MSIPLKQFVPSAVCLQCDGCCRFKSADSFWRPKIGQDEKNSLATKITGSFTDDQNYLKTIEDCGNHLCQFLNKGDSTCGIYTERPFECSLYPFILSKQANAVKVYVHLACPFVQDHQGDQETRDYISYLESFFNEVGTKEFLKRNQGLLHDYTPFELELQYLFSIEDLVL